MCNIIKCHKFYLAGQLLLLLDVIRCWFGNTACVLIYVIPWDLPVVKISPEWVTDPEQGKPSGRMAAFSLWTGMFRDGISSIPGETVIPLWLVVFSSFVRTGYTTRRWGWLLGRLAIVLHITAPYIWRDFWIRETGTGQQVAQLHERYMMMMMWYRVVW